MQVSYYYKRNDDFFHLEIVKMQVSVYCELTDDIIKNEKHTNWITKNVILAHLYFGRLLTEVHNSVLGISLYTILFI